MVKEKLKTRTLGPSQRLALMRERDKLHIEWQSLRKEVDSLLLTFGSEDYERWDDIEKRKVEIAKALRKIEEKILNLT